MAQVRAGGGEPRRAVEAGAGERRQLRPGLAAAGERKERRRYDQRQVADGRQVAIVLRRVDDRGAGAGERDHILHALDRLLRGADRWADRPGPALKEIGVRRIEARLLLAGDRVAADEVDGIRQQLLRPGEHIPLRARRVRHRHSFVQRGRDAFEHRPHL